MVIAYGHAQLLQRAVWPRVLAFTAPETNKEEGQDEPRLLDLLVTEPAMVRMLVGLHHCVQFHYKELTMLAALI